MITSALISQCRREFGDLKKSTRLMLKILKDNPRASVQSYNISVPYPCTRYFDILNQKGIFLPSRLEEWIPFNPDDYLERAPWLNNKKKSLLSVLYVSSLFIDKKVQWSISHINIWTILIRMFRFMYYPVSWFRLRYCIGVFPAESLIFKMIKRFFLRSKPN